MVLEKIKDIIQHQRKTDSLMTLAMICVSFWPGYKARTCWAVTRGPNKLFKNAERSVIPRANNVPSSWFDPIIMGTRAVWLLTILWRGLVKTVTLQIGTSASIRRREKKKKWSYPSTVGSNANPEGPFAHARIDSPGTAFKQASRIAPGDWLHPTAWAIALKDEKLGVSCIDVAAPDSIIAARKGGLMGWRWIICATDWDPALSPYQLKISIQG